MAGKCNAMEECERPRYARGWCSAHHQQWLAGKPFTKPRAPYLPRRNEPVRIDPVTGGAMVPLSGKNGEGLYALVDPADYPAVSQHAWHVHRAPHTMYAQRRTRRDDGGWSSEPLHRFLLAPNAPREIDHASGNGLDCRRSNLRPATRTQNTRNRRRFRNNTTGYVGVYPRESAGTFRAMAFADGGRHCLGSYATAEEAAHARDTFIREHYGREWHRFNFPQPGTGERGVRE